MQNDLNKEVSKILSKSTKSTINHILLTTSMRVTTFYKSIHKNIHPSLLAWGKEILTYGLLFTFYGLIIGLTKYESLRLDIIKSYASSELSSTVCFFTGIIFLPLSVLAVLPIRTRVNVNKLILPYVLFSCLYIGLATLSKVQFDRGNVAIALYIGSFLLKPLLNTVYFYCISDLFQSYNYTLTGILVVMTSALSQVFASLYKEYCISLYVTTGYSIYTIAKLLIINANLLLGLQTLFKSKGGFKPADTQSLGIKKVFEPGLNKKLFSYRLIVSILLFSLLFITLLEINEAVKIEKIKEREQILQEITKYTRLYKVTKVTVKPIGYGPFNRMVNKYWNRYLNSNYRKNNIVVNSATPYMIGIEQRVIEGEDLKEANKTLVHKKEVGYQSLLNSLLQMLTFGMLLFSWFFPQYSELTAIAYISVPTILLLLGVTTNQENLLLYTLLFSAVDMGLKKAVKDYAYTSFDFETKNYIKMYLEFAIEPIGRLLGCTIGYRLRRVIKAANRSSQLPLTYYIVYNTFALSLVLVTLIKVYEIRKLKRQKKVVNIFER